MNKLFYRLLRRHVILYQLNWAGPSLVSVPKYVPALWKVSCTPIAHILNKALCMEIDSYLGTLMLRTHTGCPLSHYLFVENDVFYLLQNYTLKVSFNICYILINYQYNLRVNQYDGGILATLEALSFLTRNEKEKCLELFNDNQNIPVFRD